MIISLPLSLLAVAAFVAAPQDDAVRPVVDPAPPAPAVETTAEELRARIKDMRMNLLLGGDQVRSAEAEATAFYSEKTQSVERRMDDVATELTEVRAQYEVTLDRALDGRGSKTGREALAEAQPLRARVVSLEGELDRLRERRERLSELVAAVGERDRERRRLVDQLEAQSVDAGELGAFPSLGIGLAPNVPVPMESGAPLEDDALLQDLLRRDPRAARALIYSADPDGYWRRFPLKLSAQRLHSAMTFPRPDPVGSR